MIRFRLSLVILCGALPASALASPETPQAILSAAPYTLHLNTECSSAITIDGTGNEQDHAVVLDNQGSGQDTGLTITGSGHEATVTGETCERASTLHVRPGTAIVATMRGFGDLHITGVDGPVLLTKLGSGATTVDQASALVLDENGFGNLQLGWLHGPATLKTTGSGDVTIARIDAPQVTAELRGFGSVRIGAGTIGALTAISRGSGHLSFGGTARAADLRATGFGGIEIENVTGELRQEAHSPATISLHRGVGSGGAGRARPVLTLPDGTVVTANSLVKPDGTVITFDDDEEAAQAGPAHHHGRSAALGFALFVLLCVIFRNRIAKLIPPGSPLRGKVGPSRPGTAQAPAASEPEILALGARLRHLDRRVGEIEQCVTSRHFHLHRAFDHLDRRRG